MTTLAHQTPTTAVQPQAITLVLSGVAIVGMVAIVFANFFYQQFQFAVDQPSDWGHTLVIPLIAGYFVYLKREQLFSRPFRTTWIGLVPIILGIAWYEACIVGPKPLLRHYFMAVGVASTLFGLVLLFCGWRAMRILWFPLAYMVVFGQTISDRLMKIVTFKLQDITAIGADIGLRLVGLDLERHGNTLMIFNNGKEFPLNIAEACSGMRMLMAFLALGVAIAYTGLPFLWQRTVLVLMAVPTAIFVNILRVMTLGLLSLYNTGLAGGEFHSFIGLLWLLPAFLIYMGVVWVLQKLVIVSDADDARPRSPRTATTPAAPRPVR